MYLNQCTFIGRLAADPEFTPKKTEDGHDRAWCRLAVNKQQKDQPPDYLTFVCWDKVAQAVAEYCQKGKEVTIVGELHTSAEKREDGSWDNRFEINCSLVSFGEDSLAVKNAKAAAKAAAPAPAAAPEVPPDMMKMLLEMVAKAQVAAVAAPTHNKKDIPF
jgi:single-stranded DNA-binding protein